MRRSTTRDYLNLIESFVDGRVSAKDFESMYLRMFKDDPTIRPNAEYQILDGLFAAVDAYCDDPSIRAAGDLDDDALRSEAKSALTALRIQSS